MTALVLLVIEVAQIGFHTTYRLDLRAIYKLDHERQLCITGEHGSIYHHKVTRLGWVGSALLCQKRIATIPQQSRLAAPSSLGLKACTATAFGACQSHERRHPRA